MRNSYSKKHGPVNEINMTPFIDIMLVLLIIFMITAPLLTVGVEVDLPETQAGTMNEDTAPLVVSIDKNGNIFIMEIATVIKALIPRLQAITKNNMETIIYVQADRTVPYGRLMDVMGRLNKAGFKKVGLIGAADATPSPKKY
ncbi:MAG: protein TolR [Alphaproteobacteria bacterium]|nr:protein TolR [Alphaproteobacteria bacterium]